MLCRRNTCPLWVGLNNNALGNSKLDALPNQCIDESNDVTLKPIHALETAELPEMCEILGAGDILGLKPNQNLCKVARAPRASSVC